MLSLALLAAVVLAAPPTTAHAQRTPPPNIVLVLTDDLTADLLRFMPAVRAMQREGASFDRYIVSNSLCCPSRASMMTGRYPHNTGVQTNLWPDGGRDIFRQRGGERENMAVDLQARGYRTAMLGKYLNEYQPTSGEVPRGWTHWAVSGKGYHGYDYNLNVNGRTVRKGRAAKDYMTDVLRRQGLRFIDESVAARKPFFVEFSPFTPHGPATPARRHVGTFDGLKAPRGPAFDQTIENGPSWLEGRRPLDAGQIAALDHRFRKRAQSVLAINQLVRQVRLRLKQRGVADNTYVVFTSDNGFHLGEHRLMPGKMTAFDYDVRVPLIVTGPDVPAGHRVAALAQNVDLRPTFADLAGAPVHGVVDGRSLAPALHGEPLRDWRRAALIEHKGPELDPSDPDYQSAPGGNPTTYSAIRFDGGLYVESENGERELYDLVRDPHALRNVYGELGAERRAELAEQVARLARCIGPVECRG